MLLERGTGRVVGALLLVQMALSIWINFSLLDPVFEAPGFLHNAAAHAQRMGGAALIGLCGSLLGLLAMSLFWPFAAAASPMLARVYAALVVSAFVFTGIEQSASLSLLSLSQAFHEAGAAANPLYQALRSVVAEQRNWVHYIGLLIGGAGLLAMHLLLFRGVWVPRLLSGFGILAALLQMGAVAQPLLGAEVPMLLLAPLGLAQLLLAMWLLLRGFASPVSAQPKEQAAGGSASVPSRPAQAR